MKRIQQILTDLECVQETFLGFSDDIWLNIEHNDSEAVQKGVEFKLAFNEKLAGVNAAGATNAHTGLHQAIHELRHGSVNEAKQLLARQIAAKSECADGAVGIGVSAF